MSLIASRYGEALFSLAKDKSLVKEYKEELDLIKSVFNAEEKLDKFFVSEKVTKNEKKEFIKQIFEKNLNKDILNFLYLLVDKGRINKYAEIIDEYHRLANDDLKIKEGIIESVRPLDENRIKELEKLFSKDGETVELKQKLNKQLISGFKITIDNKVIDASMKEKVNKMYQTLNRKDQNTWN